MKCPVSPRLEYARKPDAQPTPTPLCKHVSVNGRNSGALGLKQLARSGAAEIYLLPLRISNVQFNIYCTTYIAPH